MSSLVPVSPSRAWIRHVKHAADGTTVVHTTFAAQLLEGVNGRQGWQTTQATAQLSDDGQVTVTFPNTTGDDGLRHLDRFAVATDDDYKPGEEWIEVMRDAHEPVAVFTPIAPVRLTGQSIEITGYDVAGFLQGFRASEVDLWPGHSPRDVFEHYTRLQYLLAGRALDRGWTATGAGTDNGWDYENVTATDAQAAFSLTTGQASISRDDLQTPADCWVARGRARITQFGNGTGADVAITLTDDGDTVAIVSVRSDGTVYAQGGLRSGWVQLPVKVNVTWPAAVDATIVCLYDRLLFLVNGQLVGTQRRGLPYTAPDTVTLRASAGTSASTAIEGVFENIELEVTAPFAMRGDDKGDHHLPGLPTPGGLRARWLNEAATGVSLSGANFHAETLSPLTDPANSTLEPTVDFASGWAPTGLPGKWSARLTGAIHLNLEDGDVAVRLTTVTNLQSRVWVGRTMPGDEAWTSAAPTTYTALQAQLGAVDGWFPIRIELSHEANTLAAALQLQVAPMVDGTPGTWATVATADLSPYGCFESEIRFDSHREVIRQITEGFGYQWLTKPCTLESGLFPGQIVPRVRVGEDSGITIDAVDGVEVLSELDAGDAIDRIIVDAAGIAPQVNDDDSDTQQLSVTLTDYDSALTHFGLVSDYESLSEITEVPMLLQRAGSLLALRAGPNEQISARPLGGLARPVQTIPLSGELARMNWDPGDGIRLALTQIGVVDRTHRQLTKTVWQATPGGYGVPQVGFRQRPRGPDVVLRRALRAGIASQRNSPQLSQVQRYRRATAS